MTILIKTINAKDMTNASLEKLNRLRWYLPPDGRRGTNDSHSVADFERRKRHKVLCG